ncbi:MAG: transporter permease [Solirubrobacteraceae bacterium]|nr:transporter permease [Solirubrobacteraceae bacterium]
MRWLAVKDLQILRRSPLLLVVLVVYSLGLGVAVGLSRGSGPAKPRVAVVNEIPPDQSSFNLGNEKIDANKYANELFRSIEPIRVKTVAEALAKVRSGDALGALIIPADITSKLEGTINLTGGPPPSVDFYYQGDNPLKSRYVQSAVGSRIADANRALSQKITVVAARYLGYILHGGQFSLLGQTFDVLGLVNANRIVRAVETQLPAGSSGRAALDRVASFGKLASDNLDLSNQLLGTIGAPIQVHQHILGATKGSDDAYTFAIALSIPLMFVCVLLGAGLLALEREENAFGRLVRGLVSRTAIVAEKAAIAAGLGTMAAALTLAVLVASGSDVAAGHLLAALLMVVVGALAFGALGVALGAAAREVRTASLLAVLVLLPIAVIGLIPVGLASPGLYDAIRAVSAVFPFRVSLNGIDEALRGVGTGVRLGHLALLAVSYAVLARLALRRFA